MASHTLETSIDFHISDQKTVGQQVYEELRQRIVHGRLRPGQRLNEARIAQDMGISRAPVREAVQRLRQDGLVTTKPRHGPVVAEITAADAAHLYRLRSALEELAVVLFIERGAQGALKELEDVVKAMIEAGQAGNLAQMVEQDVRFHEALCEHSGNPLLSRIYQMISAQFRIAAIQDDARTAELSEIARAHAELLETIGQRDVSAAVSRLREHILSTLPNLVSRLNAQAAERTP
ncbi:MAG TPA: GntR family transcriptional regulator [bacterium]|nr:GntR family transcriptional regulator [bacterium]